jgi:hypothetical protein
MITNVGKVRLDMKTNGDKTMVKYYVNHKDADGETHSIGPAFEAASKEAAIAYILRESGAEDDGMYSAEMAE